MFLPKMMVSTPTSMAERIDRMGDPSVDYLKGSPRFIGGWEGWNSRAELLLWKPGVSVA